VRHRVAGRHYGRHCGHSRALLRNLVTSLIEHGRIETTLAKAREVRKIAEPIVTRGIRGDMHARRQVAGYVFTKSAVGKLFNDIAPRMKGRPGGYLRILKTRFRPGDCSQMAVVEFVDFEEVKAAADKKEGKKKAAKKKEGEKEG